MAGPIAVITTTQQRSTFGALRGLRMGAGPRLVMLHGVGLRADAWDAQIKDLREDHDLLALDMPGHGHSPRVTTTPTLQTYSALVADAMDGPAWLIGHSMGAMIALDLAIRRPELVRGVVALNAIFRRSASAQAAVGERAARLDGVTQLDPSETLQRWFGDASSAEAAACNTWLRSVDPAGYRDAYRVFAAEDGPEDDALGQLPCPALFCTGAEDPNSTPAMSHATARMAPKGRAKIIAGAAHMMPMTHATELNAVLRNFITEGQR